MTNNYEYVIRCAFIIGIKVPPYKGNLIVGVCTGK